MLTGLQKWQEARRAGRKADEELHRAMMEANREQLAANRRQVEREERERRKIAAAVAAAKRLAAELQRTPSWADHEAISKFYAQARALTRRTGIPHHVDHIIPLQGRKVSGLHVQNNMQVLTASENARKCNTYEPC
jgi:hypothetical protein